VRLLQREGSGVRLLRLLINVDIFSEGFDCPEV
jgi:superfamily II DNA or RNA helicase